MRSMTLALLLSLSLSLAIACPFAGSDWQSAGAKAKLAALQSNITNTPGSPGWYSQLQVAQIFIEDMNTSFDTVADCMPKQSGLFGKETRPKLIHSVGVSATAKWVVKDNAGFTGVFKTGADLIVRLSAAKQPSQTEKINIAPGISLKFLRNGAHSGNTMGLWTLAGQSGWNFFEHDLTNHVPAINPALASTGEDLLLAHFLSASAFPTFLGLADLASIDANGVTTGSPNFPFRLQFHPTTTLHNMFDSTYPGKPFEIHLEETIPANIPLYHVYAFKAPNDPNSAAVHIADITTTSAFSTSSFGDREMFFQHTRFEDDLKFQPSWEGPSKSIVLKQSQQDPAYTFPDFPFTN